MGLNGFLFNLVYLLHLTTVIVGFGSAIVSSFLAARARVLEGPERRAVIHVAYQLGQSLTTGPVVAAGVFGLVLVVLSDSAFKFSQTWISLAFLLYFGVVGVLFFLVNPNAKAMDELSAQLTDGRVTASKAGGPPREVAELVDRGKKAAAFTGIVHLLWVLLLVDMIWKPGL
jgi:MFS family permease